MQASPEIISGFQYFPPLARKKIFRKGGKCIVHYPLLFPENKTQHPGSFLGPGC